MKVLKPVKTLNYRMVSGTSDQFNHSLLAQLQCLSVKFKWLSITTGIDLMATLH